MNIDRPHRTTSTPTTTTSSELFICFASRLSHSSSIRISSKSILSPGRAGEKPTGSNQALSTSLSRRLRHSGSLRAGAGAGAVGQSPSMFSSKKSKGGGSGFDNPEPSSPKVTCIGQVRVKTKKQGKKMKMRGCRSKSKRHSGGLTPQNSLGGSNANQDGNLRNQGWVHLPVAICEAIRAFGSEFSCLLPCKSSCFSNCGGGERGDNGGGERKDGYSSCGAVCRWLVEMQDGEEEKERRDVEIVVGGDDEEERMECSRRRSIFDDMEFKDDIFDVKNGGGGRVSICVPPKNALLLMRCRSDPMKMSSLSQKVWEAPVDDFDSEAEDDKAECDEDVEVICLENDEIFEEVDVDEEDGYDLDIFNEEEVETEEGAHLMEEGEDEQVEEDEEEDILVEEKIDNGESEVEEENTEESNQLSCLSSSSSADEESTIESLDENERVNDQEMVKSIVEDQVNEEDWEEDEEMKKQPPILPDCLLLMMREPKLSMEVSKETWVCTTDFIRWLPESHPSKISTKIDGSDVPKEKKSGVAPPVHPVVQVTVQPGRSSISFPTGGGPVVNMIDKKLVKPGGGGGGGIEPFVLSRCKSAPMRSAGKNGLPELPCSLWRRESSRKIEPHRPSFGTTGVGF